MNGDLRWNMEDATQHPVGENLHVGIFREPRGYLQLLLPAQDPQMLSCSKDVVNELLTSLLGSLDVG